MLKYKISIKYLCILFTLVQLIQSGCNDNFTPYPYYIERGDIEGIVYELQYWDSIEPNVQVEDISVHCCSSEDLLTGQSTKNTWTKSDGIYEFKNLEIEDSLYFLIFNPIRESNYDYRSELSTDTILVRPKVYNSISVNCTLHYIGSSTYYLPDSIIMKPGENKYFTIYNTGNGLQYYELLTRDTWLSIESEFTPDGCTCERISTTTCEGVLRGLGANIFKVSINEKLIQDKYSVKKSYIDLFFHAPLETMLWYGTMPVYVNWE